MTTPDMLSINNVAAKLGLSVHQLRRWELMFGLEIKRGRGQQRQYREEDLSVLERIKELVEQGWPTSQIRPQLEAEGLVTPKLIGVPPNPGNPEVLQESIIGLRNFTERRFIEISKQIDELRQLLISVTLKQELSTDKGSPWQPVASEYVPAPKVMPPQEITIGPQISIDPPSAMRPTPPSPRPIIGAPAQPRAADNDALARSMSAVNSLFNESPSSTPQPSDSGTGSGAPTAKPVRFSTIPPLPSELAAMEEQLVGTAIPSSTSPGSDSSGDDMIVPSSHPAVLSDLSEPAQDVIQESPMMPPPMPAPDMARPKGDPIELDRLTPDNPIFGQQRMQSMEPIPPLPPNPFRPTPPAATAAEETFGHQEVPVPASQPAAQEQVHSQPFQQLEQPASSAGHSMPSFETAAAEPPQAHVESFAPGQAAMEATASTETFVADPDVAFVDQEDEPEAPNLSQPIALTPGPQVNFGPNVAAPTPQAAPQRIDDNFGLGEVTDQNYLTVLGRALDLIGWTDEQADSYSLKTFGIPHWDELGRSQAEKLVAHLIALLKEQMG